MYMQAHLFFRLYSECVSYYRKIWLKELNMQNVGKFAHQADHELDKKY